MSSEAAAGAGGQTEDRPAATPDELELMPGQVTGPLNFTELFGRERIEDVPVQEAVEDRTFELTRFLVTPRSW